MGTENWTDLVFGKLRLIQSLGLDNVQAITDVSDLPTALFHAAFAQTEIKFKVGDADQFSKITYFDDEFSVIGFADVNETATRDTTSYRSADEMKQYGSSWSDDTGSGYRFYSRGIDEDGTITGTSGTNYKIEEGGETTNTGESEPFEIFNFIYRIEPDGMETFLSGTETRGSKTIEYGENKVPVNESVSVTGLEVLGNPRYCGFDDGYIEAYLQQYLPPTSTVTLTEGTDGQILLQGVDWGPVTLSELGSFGDNWIAEHEEVKFDVSALNSVGISVAFYEDDAAGTLYETGVTTSDDGNTLTVVLPGGLAEEGNTSELYLFAEDSEGVKTLQGEIDVLDIDFAKHLLRSRPSRRKRHLFVCAFRRPNRTCGRTI